MTLSRRAAAYVTDATCRLIGREAVVRASRFTLNYARRDQPNDMRTNGELELQRWAMRLSEPGHTVNVLDVGANVGEWSMGMVYRARAENRIEDLRLYAFEPSLYTFRCLQSNLSGYCATPCRLAMSDVCGSSVLHIVGPGAGTNTLVRESSTGLYLAEEGVPVSTLDDFTAQVGINSIDLVKIDTEGNDLAVMRGAGQLLSGRRIKILQFEYNHRWIYARSFLRDVFEYLLPLNYTIGKLTPAGVEFYSGWSPILETFIEGNYVACAVEIAQRIPSVRWWKDSAKHR